MDTDFKILIVEDNVIIADDLQLTLEDLGYTVLDSVISYEKAIDYLDNNSVDLVLLDISLATKKTGIDVAQYINEIIKIPFIFITSNSDSKTIKEASKTKPNAYLVKPFDKKNIHASIELAVTNHNIKETSNSIIKDNLFVKKNNLYHKISINNIAYVKADNVYLEIYSAENKKYILRSTLKSFFLKLPDNFHKCHKSYIINLDHVMAFNARQVVVNNTKIPVSEEFKTFLKNFITK